MNIINLTSRDMTPEKTQQRIKIITDIVSIALAQVGPVSQSEIFSEVMRRTGKMEEEVGREIIIALFLLTQTPILNTNTFGSQGGDTVFDASPKFSNYALLESMGFESGDDDGE